MSEFNAQSTTGQVMAGVSLAGKVALVTGASAGLVKFMPVSMIFILGGPVDLSAAATS